ncbi:PUA-like domain-containing protein [Suillus paluster]|uniref:PUA-like domain-containing protein n=1 Tax=Suillus paluster TaxID=48578 RepID=UPI001B86557E|nr:PUA-like domain-containing protein [Suillus paluster]KAG1747140.1 PUA-like domain-containing protein [Suillus paluster]
MDLLSPLEGVEYISSSSDEEMEIGPEEIARKEGQEVRVSSSRPAQRFGEIPGVKVGAKWENRKGCSIAGVHRLTQGGICGNKGEGAFSVVLSNYYAHNKDLGDTIDYAGSGGREIIVKGGRSVQGQQIHDQDWSGRGNAALRTSRHTGKPVRVIRSHKGLSKFAPAEGLRYDGLYTVKKAWKDKNADGLDICLYRLERVPGQPPLPCRPGRGAGRGPSPASVTTSDKTVISPSGTPILHQRDVWSSESEDDHANVAKKRKLAYRPAPSSLSGPPPASTKPSSFRMERLRKLDDEFLSKLWDDKEVEDKDLNRDDEEEKDEDLDCDDEEEDKILDHDDEEEDQNVETMTSPIPSFPFF